MKRLFGKTKLVSNKFMRTYDSTYGDLYIGIDDARGKLLCN